MPKMTYEQFLARMNSLFEEKKKYEENPNQTGDPYKDNKRKHEIDVILNKVYSKFFEKMTFAIPENQRYDFLMKLFPDEAKKDCSNLVFNHMNYTYVNGKRILENHPNGAALVKIFDPVTISMAKAKGENINVDDYARRAISCLEGLPENVKQEAKNEFYKGFFIGAGNLIMHDANKQDLYSKAMAVLEKEEDLDLSECIPEESEFLFVDEKTNDYTTHLHHEEIEQLKNETDDADYKTILTEIDDILVQITGKDLNHEMSDVAENGADFGSHLIRDEAYVLAESDPKYKGHFIPAGNANLKSDLEKLPKDDYAPFFNDLSKEQTAFSDEYKNQILSLTDDLEKIYPYKEEEDLPEQGTKVYAFKGLTQKKEALEEAILSGDKDKIKAAYGDYKETEKAYDQLLAIAGSMNDKGYYPGNVSCSRNDSLPVKYVLDPVRVSRLNGAYELFCLSKRTGIPVKEYLDHPEKSFLKTYENLINEKSKMSDYLRNNTVADLLINGSNPLLNMELASQDTYTSRFAMRAIQFICSCSKERGKNTLWAEKLSSMIGVTADVIATSVYPSITANDTSTLVTNLLFCEKEDINAAAMSKTMAVLRNPYTNEKMKPFDGLAYLREGRTSLSRIVERLSESVADFESKHPTNDEEDPLLISFRDGIANTVSTLLDTPEIAGKMDKTTKAVLKEVRRNVNNAGPLAIKESPAFRKYEQFHIGEKAWNEAVHHNYDKTLLQDALKNAYDFQKRYDSSWFFMKWFSFSTKALKANADAVYNGLKEKGISSHELELAKDSITKNDEDSLYRVCSRISGQLAVADDLELHVNGKENDLILQEQIKIQVHDIADELKEENQNEGPENKFDIGKEEEEEFDLEIHGEEQKIK